MKKARWFGWIVLTALLGLAVGGCGDDPDETPGTKTPEEPGPSPLIGEVVWMPCDVGMFSVDCATVDVPLDWDAPEGRRIEVFVRKVPTLMPHSKGQLWYLVGGPGAGAGAHIPFAAWYAEHGWDVYLMDYRGVGESTNLGCGGGPEEFAESCQRQLLREWGDGLRHFSTTGAALDLGALIDATRKTGEQVMIVGESYGTYVANRYQHLFPKQADGLILNGICPPTGCNLHAEKNFNRVVQELIERCGEDDFCASKVGSDPWAWTVDLLDRLDRGHCSEFYWGGGRSAFAWVLMGLIRSRELLPAGVAALHRIDRCEPEDVAAVTHLLGRLMGQSGAALQGHERPSRSRYLYFNIIFSEFWDPALETDDYREELARLPFPFGAIEMVEWKKRSPWKLYETPSHLRTWAPSSVPMLFLNGDLDFQTTIWDLDDLDAAYGGEGQRFHRLPFTGHGSEHPCPWQLVSSFVSDPLGPQPVECLAQMQDIPWAGNAYLANQLMGTNNLWTIDTISALEQEPPASAQAIDEIIERTRAELRRLVEDGVLPLPAP